MPVPILSQGDTVTCEHGGQATPATANPRVLIGGEPAVSVDQTWTISGCSLTAAQGGPCVSATFTTAATRVASNGHALVLQDGQALCVPTGAPLRVVVAQTRVTAI